MPAEILLIAWKMSRPMTCGKAKLFAIGRRSKTGTPTRKYAMAAARTSPTKGSATRAASSNVRNSKNWTRSKFMTPQKRLLFRVKASLKCKKSPQRFSLSIMSINQSRIATQVTKTCLRNETLILSGSMRSSFRR